MSEDHTLSLPSGLRLDAEAIRRHPQQVDGVLIDLYGRLRPAVVGYLSQLVGSTPEAEDVLQVAFLRLFDALQEGQEIQNVRSWVYRVAHNLAIDSVRSRHRRLAID